MNAREHLLEILQSHGVADAVEWEALQIELRAIDALLIDFVTTINRPDVQMRGLTEADEKRLLSQSLALGYSPEAPRD